MFVFKTLNRFSFFYFCIVNYTENFPMHFLDFLFFFQCTHLWKDLKKTTTNMHICVPMHLNDEIASYTNVVESIVSCHADCLVLFIRLNGQWLFFFCEVISDLRICSGWMHINERHPGYAKKWWIENVFARLLINDWEAINDQSNWTDLFETIYLQPFFVQSVLKLLFNTLFTLIMPN